MTSPVGVVTTIGCPYCKRAKDALTQAGVEFVNADLTGNPSGALTRVKEFTGQRTVPQIFIGGDFIGGASELLELMGKGGFAEKVAAARGQPAFPARLDGLVSAARSAKVKEAAAQPAASDEAAQLASELEQTLVRKTRTVGKRQILCATGADLVEYLDARKLPIAETVAKLLKLRILAPAVVADAPAPSDARFSATDATYYQLLSDCAPPGPGEPLNTHYQWHGPARPAVDVSGDLRGRILDLYDAHLSPDGRAVDYKAMAEDPRFRDYVNAAAELQRVDLTPLSREERIAFFINIYNALIVHATVIWGSPDTLLKRLKFFSSAIYHIGGAFYSADDVEHGMLRANAPSPASVGSLLGLPFLKPPQIPAGDPRLSQIVVPMDPRIHFALVCGAKSCPPIKLYTPDNLEEGLQDAAVSFCESEITVDVARATVTLSKIFKWYGKDFAAKERDRLERFAEWCSDEKRAQIEALLEGKKFKLVYKEYDWSPNSK